MADPCAASVSRVPRLYIGAYPPPGPHNGGPRASGYAEVSRITDLGPRADPHPIFVPYELPASPQPPMTDGSSSQWQAAYAHPVSRSRGTYRLPVTRPYSSRTSTKSDSLEAPEEQGRICHNCKCEKKTCQCTNTSQQQAVSPHLTIQEITVAPESKEQPHANSHPPKTSKRRSCLSYFKFW